MARIARVVLPGVPHHVTQRGNRRMATFFCEDDYIVYLRLMSEWCGRCGVEIWAYCLMPNHTHLIAVPQGPSSLCKAIGEAHRRYTRRVNLREGWRGYLWAGRFASFPMDDRHLYMAARYLELNPVRAGFVKRPEDYRWSSARAHLSGEDDVLVKTEPLLFRWRDWGRLLGEGLGEGEAETLRRHTSTGRPLGDDAFVEKLEKALARTLRLGRPGRPKLQK